MRKLLLQAPIFAPMILLACNAMVPPALRRSMSPRPKPH